MPVIPLPFRIAIGDNSIAHLSRRLFAQELRAPIAPRR
jgi:hypothetical protein